MINQNTKEKINKVREYISRIEKEEKALADFLFNDEGEVVEATKESVGKRRVKVRRCKKCGEAGHRRDSCTFNISKKDESIDNKEGGNLISSKDLVEEVKKMWGREGMLSADVCQILGISMTELNNIIVKNKIIKEND